jgi:hypothetical protein
MKLCGNLSDENLLLHLSTKLISPIIPVNSRFVDCIEIVAYLLFLSLEDVQTISLHPLS